MFHIIRSTGTEIDIEYQVLLILLEFFRLTTHYRVFDRAGENPFSEIDLLSVFLVMHRSFANLVPKSCHKSFSVLILDSLFFCLFLMPHQMKHGIVHQNILYLVIGNNGIKNTFSMSNAIENHQLQVLTSRHILSFYSLSFSLISKIPVSIFRLSGNS